MTTDMDNKLPYTTIRADIAHALRFGPLSVAQMLGVLPYDETQLRNMLRRMAADNAVLRTGQGIYSLPAPADTTNLVPRRDRAHDFSPTGKFSLVHSPDMTTPPARPGAMDYAALPSRRGNRLFYRDGRVEILSLQGSAATPAQSEPPRASAH